ncbi:GNAT family N-acetyltransferase [Streptomyces griseoluteus]|uniref:GNAT family N-acetyltransferase n=1 Tax=Streptomyces griseoluteus TaxID=29306 RepID=UPI0036F97CB2
MAASGLPLTRGLAQRVTALRPDELVAWGWAFLPHRVRRDDGSVTDVTGATLSHQVHPDHAALADEVIERYDAVAAGLERTALPTTADEYALTRWAAHGYEPEAPDGTMAASTIRWLDHMNKTVEFEPVGAHPAYRRRGLARATMLHGMRLARAAGATHATVVCLGAPSHPKARGLYHGLGFRELSRDAPLIKSADRESAAPSGTGSPPCGSSPGGGTGG